MRYTMIHRHKLTAVSLVVGMLAAMPARAATTLPAATEWFEHDPDRAWLEPYDPTLIPRRVLSELSLENLSDDRSVWKIETSLRWGIPIRKDLAFGWQALLPVKWLDTSSSDESGLGDIELRTGFVGRILPTLRYAAGLNAQFDSATDSALGDNAFLLKPILALRWDAASRLNVGINVEYTFTPFDEGTNDVSQLELKFPLVFKITDDWSGSVTYKPAWNLLADSNRHRLEFGANVVMGAHNQYALSFGVEVPLTADDLDCKFITGLARSF